jgi:hypothetical protein
LSSRTRRPSHGVVHHAIGPHGRRDASQLILRESGAVNPPVHVTPALARRHLEPNARCLWAHHSALMPLLAALETTPLLSDYSSAKSKAAWECGDNAPWLQQRR